MTVLRPDGTILPHRPEQVDASAEALPTAVATRPGYGGERFDLDYVVGVMLSHAA
jgi:hypothetical protein